MNFSGKYVFFYCDECSLLDPVITVFQVLHPTVNVHTFSAVDALIAHTTLNTPEFILVYLSKPGHDFIKAVKYIRENVNSAAIPVIIYQQLPEVKELQDLFLKMI